MEDIDTLRLARRWIIARGHCKGTYTEGQSLTRSSVVPEDRPDITACCARGALFLATPSHAQVDRLERRLLDEVPQAHWQRMGHSLVPNYTSILGYNDHPDTTQEDVLALYDRAIASMTPEAR